MQEIYDVVQMSSEIRDEVVGRDSEMHIISVSAGSAIKTIDDVFVGVETLHHITNVLLCVDAVS